MYIDKFKYRIFDVSLGDFAHFSLARNNLRTEDGSNKVINEN